MIASEQHKRIAKNTLMLYTRQLLILGVGLYTVRVTLNVLGIEDYGIYNVIAGIVTMFAFLGSSMASATQRFFSFALGQNDRERLNKTFTVNWVIYGGIALLAIVLLETVGLWFINNELKLPPDRLAAAQWVYQFSVLTFAVGILSTPFTAIIIAHEDMHIYAYISVVESLLKLLTVVLLIYLPFEKLILYSILTLALTTVRSLAFVIICSYKYEECQYRRFYWDMPLMKEIVGFTGWTLFGQFTTMGRTQAITVLLNQVFNPSVVAARAISTNICNQVNIFSGNFNIGLYPPIIKAYADGRKEEMLSLIANGAKITFFLMWVFALPLFLEMEAILRIWLGEVPAETVRFTRLALVEALIFAVSRPLTTAARAPGRMMTYELSLGSIQIGIFIAAWIILKMGAPAYSVYVVAIVANLLMFFVRLFIVRGLIGLPIRPFMRETVLPLCVITVVSAVPSMLMHLNLPKGILYSGLTFAGSIVFSVISMYYLGLNKVWREKVKSIVKNRIGSKWQRMRRA